MNDDITCPACGQGDAVEKVSTIYLLGIGLARGGNAPQEGGGQPQVAKAPHPHWKELSKRLAPPAGGREGLGTRPVSPDMVVLTFTLVIPVFLVGILTSQRALLPVALLILAAFYAIYFALRKRLMAKFARGQAERAAKAERIKAGIARWMQLYYCERDDVVFEPGKGQAVPAERMNGLLFEK
ncbi:MAG: hypothetical protein JW726_03825 [Anaerolineales bacterium]|nr:hypothetical protein [Anaerolineales bacterium]